VNFGEWDACKLWLLLFANSETIYYAP